METTRNTRIGRKPETKTSSGSETVLPSVGETFPPRKYDFVNLNDFLRNETYCNFCSKIFSIGGLFFSYPVRLPCSCIFCYEDCDAWLSVYRDCPQCDAPLGDPALARESIEFQVDQCRQHYLAQERLSTMTEKAAELSLQRRQSGDVCTRKSSADFDPALENVLAALTLLDVEPIKARNVDMKDLEAALSMMDLSDESTVAQLPGILETISAHRRP